MTDPPQPSADAAAQRQQQLDTYKMSALQGMLPPPDEDTPEAWADRDRIAIAIIAEMVPTNASEVGLAVQYVATMAHARHCLRQALKYRDEPKLAHKLWVQSNVMGREARSYRMLLLRAQATRRKCQEVPAHRDADARTEQYVIARMTEALDRSRAATRPAPPRAIPTLGAPAVAAPAAPLSMAAARAPGPATAALVAAARTAPALAAAPPMKAAPAAVPPVAAARADAPQAAPRIAASRAAAPAPDQHGRARLRDRPAEADPRRRLETDVPLIPPGSTIH